jgi:hypothetical protein
MNYADYQAQREAIAKRQQIAQAIMQAGTQGGAQGQMVSGRYVAPSALASIAPILQTALGTYGNSKATDELSSLDKSHNSEIAKALSDYSSADEAGRPAALEALTSETMDPADLAKAQVAQAMTPKAPIPVAAGTTLYDPTSHKSVFTAPEKAPKRTVEWKDVGNQLVPVYSDDGTDVLGLKPKPKTVTPDQKLTADSKPQFGGRTEDLLASLASRGVSLPAGYRSKEQMASTLNGLLAKYPDKTSDEIAEAIASGQINFGAEKKETQTAAGLGGKISYAENEIKQITPLIREASSKVPRGSFVSWNKLKQLGDAQISDPNLKEFKSYMNTLSNAYDMLAARGGTDMEKRKHNREMFDTADSPEALEAALRAVENEATISGNAAGASMRPRSERNAPPADSSVPPDIAALLKKHGGS